MSRVGNKPVEVLSGVTVKVDGQTVSVEGPKGKLSYDVRPEIEVKLDDEGKNVLVGRRDDDRESRAYHGLTRALINNMVVGVKDGYEKKLEVVGVGVCDGRNMLGRSRLLAPVGTSGRNIRSFL